MGHDYDDHAWGMGAGRGWSGWLMMTIVLMIFLGLVAVLLYGLVRGSAAAGAATKPEEVPGQARSSAARVLDERLARGEIDVADYEQRKTALRGI
jgi:putative membrane protein